MPRYLPSVGASSVGLTYIGFFPGGLRSHSRSCTALKHSGVTPSRYTFVNSSGGAFHSFALHSGVSRSNDAPAKFVRVIRFVKFGAAPANTYRSGREMIGLPSESVRPLTWWQRAQLLVKRVSPSAAGVSAAAFSYGASWLSTHDLNPAASSTTASWRMYACERPQNSVH